VTAGTAQVASPARAANCPVCGDGGPADLLEIPAVPVYCNVLWPRREEALRAARAPISLKHCAACGHTFNAAYDAGLTEYSPAYDSSLHYSPRFQRYAEALARRLVDRYALRGKDVVEIGCGKGDFLVLLCELGDNRGWGFDRSFDPERVEPVRSRRIDFVQDFYSAEQAARLRPDFVCFRHVLEHVADPRGFLAELRRGFPDGSEAALYCEVPNALFTLGGLGIWDLIYEHCAYFTLGSLARAATSSGFDVLAMGEAFEGQFIFVEMRPGTGRAPATAVPEDHQPREVGGHAAWFAERYRDTVGAWRGRLRELQDAGRIVVVWGGGSKGTTFLNVLGTGSGIDYVVDLNPHKHGKYVAGTGQRVVPPEFLRELRPTDVIVMNPVYESEIAGSIRALGLDARVHCA
jgi:SAM-dependent methyltransferase